MKRTLLSLIMIAFVIGFGVFAFLKIAAGGFSAKAEPTAIEKFAARFARRLAAPSSVRSKLNPEPNTPEVLAEARAHWADHCANCHAKQRQRRLRDGAQLVSPRSGHAQI